MVLCLQASVSSVYQNGMMRYSSSVPSDSDTHDDFKPTQKVPPGGSTDSLKELVENVTLRVFFYFIFEFCIWLEFFGDDDVLLWVVNRM